MKQWQQTIKEWWQQLTQREKQMVSAGSAVLSLFVLYAGIWSPYLDHLADMRKRIETGTHTLAWMQAADQRLRKLSVQTAANGKADSPVALMTFLQKQLEQTRLESALSELKQTGGDTVQINFHRVEFDKLIALLMTAVKQKQVTIQQLSVVTSDSPGMVNADVVLQLT